MQDRSRGLVRKVDVLKAHIHGPVGSERLSARRVGHLALAVHQREHLVQVGQVLLDLAVDHAQKVERDVELDHEGVHHHQIAQRQPAIDHALRGHPQHGDQADGDDELLAGVEQRQRGLAFQARAAQRLQAFVVAARLEAFVVEVLDRLVVQQRVDRLGVGA